MVMFYSRTVSHLLNKYPGKKFGIYRFIPVFFLFGAGLEFFMIKFTFKEANFYSVYKRNEAHRRALEEINKEREATS